MPQSLPLPKYHSVYLVLRERLRDGVYDDRVPGELELMEQFNVSRVTVRKALENLAAEGWIERTAGRGTRRLHPPAGDPKTAKSTPHFAGLLDNIVAASLATTVKVFEYEMVRPPVSVADALQLEGGGDVLRVVRVRRMHGAPLSHITTWVPQALAKGLGRRQLGRKPMLVLMEESGIEIGRATQTISARQADAVVAERLDLALGSALLSVTRLVYDIHERPVLWLQGLYCPERYEYKMELSRVGGIDAKIWVANETPSR